MTKAYAAPNEAIGPSDTYQKYNVCWFLELIFTCNHDQALRQSRVAEATHKGTLGIYVKASRRSDSDSHVPCVYTRDDTDETDVEKEHEGLR
jgi:Domain of unknown function (DUF1917).